MRYLRFKGIRLSEWFFNGVWGFIGSLSSYVQQGNWVAIIVRSWNKHKGGKMPSRVLTLTIRIMEGKTEKSWIKQCTLPGPDPSQVSHDMGSMSGDGPISRLRSPGPLYLPVSVLGKAFDLFVSNFLHPYRRGQKRPYHGILQIVFHRTLVYYESSKASHKEIPTNHVCD